MADAEAARVTMRELVAADARLTGWMLSFAKPGSTEIDGIEIVGARSDGELSGTVQARDADG